MRELLRLPDSEADVQIATLALASMALGSAMSSMLLQHAAANGNQEGFWLEDFRHQILRGIKNIHSEGLTPEGELIAMERAIRLVDVHIEAARVLIRLGALQASVPRMPDRGPGRPGLQRSVSR